MRRQRDQDPARPAASPDGAGVVRLSPRRRSFDAVPSSQRPKSCASSPPLRCLAGHGPPCTTGDDRLRRLAEPCPLLPAGPQPREQRHLQGLREDFLRDYARLNPRPDAISVPTGSAPLGSRAAYPMQSSPWVHCPAIVQPHRVSGLMRCTPPPFHARPAVPAQPRRPQWPDLRTTVSIDEKTRPQGIVGSCWREWDITPRDLTPCFCSGLSLLCCGIPGSDWNGCRSTL